MPPRTTIVRPIDRTLREALSLALLFAAIKLALHVVESLWEAHIGWGYYSDEMYYVMCGRHLAWGYVDHGPIVALQARISEIVFGDSLPGLRLLSALAGAGRVFLTGLLAWSLGGRRPAQGLAMLGVLVAPQYIGVDGYLSMNSWESIFWMTCLLVLILMLRAEPDPVERLRSQRLWLVFGLSAGIGLLNKPSMAFFLLALLAALLVTPQRRLLANRWAVAGVALISLIVSPYVLWQLRHHWPTLEFLITARIVHANLVPSYLGFIRGQLGDLGKFFFIVWFPGFLWLLRRKDERWLGLTFAFFLLGMLVMREKDYYVTPIYPIVFAGGGIAWESFFARRKRVLQNRALAFPLYQAALVLHALVVFPVCLPILPPARLISYALVLHLYRPNDLLAKYVGPLPPFFADRFGWQEEADEVKRIYDSLPPDQRRITGVLCANYGEASAINFLGRGIPVAISPRNNYYLWGTNGYTGDSMILIAELPRETLLKYFDHVEVVGHMTQPWSMRYEHQDIFLATGRKFQMAALWPTLKQYF